MSSTALMPLRDPATDYCTSAVSELLRIEPRLAPLRVKPTRTRIPIGSTAAAGQREFGCLGGLLFGLAASGLFRNHSRKAKFVAHAPNQPRRHTVKPPLTEEQAALTLDLHVSDGTCTLRVGRAQVHTRGLHLAKLPRSPQLWKDVPPDPTGDAAYVGHLIRGIFDDRIAIIRKVTFFERGMGGPLRPNVSDHLYNLDRESFECSAGDPLTGCAEAIMLSWSGEHDGFVIEPRYSEMEQRLLECEIARQRLWPGT